MYPLLPTLDLNICVGSKAGAAYVKAGEYYIQTMDTHDAARRFDDAAIAYQKTDVDCASVYGDRNCIYLHTRLLSGEVEEREIYDGERRGMRRVSDNSDDVWCCNEVAVRSIQRASDIYASNGRFSAAAKSENDSARIYEAQGNLTEVRIGGGVRGRR